MNQLQTDHYFHIGKAHLTGGKPCQDYAISQVYQDAAFALVCDGCSSGRHTDVGSRILGLSTLKALKQYWQTNPIIEMDKTLTEINLNQKIKLAAARELLGLEQKVHLYGQPRETRNGISLAVETPKDFPASQNFSR